MKTRTRNLFKNLPMSWFMTGVALVGLVLVPVFWITSHYALAIAMLLGVLTMLVQAACIDLPGSSYSRLHRLWKHKTSGRHEPPAVT